MAKLRVLATTVMGSWALPGWYAHFCETDRSRPETFGADDRNEAVEDAVRLAVNDQLQAGVDLITDGEMQRNITGACFYSRFDGIEPLAPTRLWGAPAHDQRARYVCVDHLGAPRGMGVVDEIRRLRKLADLPCKAAVPGPYTLADSLDGGSIYPDRDAVARAVSPIVNQELRQLVAERVQFIQVDEPSFACQPADADGYLGLLDQTLEGIDAHISLHVCFGNYAARAMGMRSYRRLFPLLTRAPVQQLALEFASREMAEIELLRQVPPSMGVAIGLVDVKNSWVEPPDFIAHRLRQVLEHIEPERVTIAPDCGFAQTSRSLACRKLRNMVAGVHQIRAELGV